MTPNQTPRQKLLELFNRALPSGKSLEGLTPPEIHAALHSATMVVDEVTTLLIFDIPSGFQHTKTAVDFYIQVQKEIHAARLMSISEFRTYLIS